MFFGYFLNIKKVTPSADFVIGPAKAEAFLFSHTRLPFPPRPLLPFGRISPAAKPGWPVVAPAGGNVLAPPFSLRSNVAPRSHPGPPRFQLGFCCAKTGGRVPPAFGRRGVDKARKYHFVCVVLSSAPLTLSPLYAPARPVFRNRPKEKAAAENRCGCEHAIYEL